MSSAEHHQHPAIEQTEHEVPGQHVEEGTPQHDGASPLHKRSSSQDTLVSVDDHEPVTYDTQGFAQELERGLYPPAQQTEIHSVMGSAYQYDGPSRHNRSFSQDTLVSVGDHDTIRDDTLNPIYEPKRDQYPPIHQTMESTYQYDGSPQKPNRTFSQSTVYSVDDPTKPVLRRPAPRGKGDQYISIQQTERYPPDESTDGSFLQKVGRRRHLTPFVSYGLALLFVFLASLGFWIQGRRRPIYFSKSHTIWMFRNPKTMAMLWTSIAASLAWCTLLLHACTVSLMARKLIVRGAKISTIECNTRPHPLSRFGVLIFLLKLG